MADQRDDNPVRYAQPTETGYGTLRFGSQPTTWNEAPEGVVLDAGGCDAPDADGQPCADRRGHHGPHQGCGLRRWLEAGFDRAIIRPYAGPDADELEAIEAPLFAEFGFAPIARCDIAYSVEGGIRRTDAFLFGALVAPRQTLPVEIRTVCFALVP